MISGVLASILLQAGASVPPVQPPPACDTPQHAEFDFWVGEWDVYPNGSTDKVAESRIEKLYSGCAIRENWMPIKGGAGGSLNSLDPATGRWHQTWIGSSPGKVEFTGGKVADGMVLTGYWQHIGGPGKHGLVRMTYTPNPNGWVQQFGEVSYDHGANWSPSFDFIYKPRERD